MCKAFSCVIGRDKTVTWRFGTDSHEDLIRIAGYKDDTLDPEKIEFCRIEISPKNRSYLEPDEWVFKIDMDVTPAWWTLAHKRACEREHKKWIKELDKVLVRKPIVHPFQITPPEKITDEHIQLVREWDSVRASVGDPVVDSVWDSAWDSVWASVMDLVRASVRDSVWDSVVDSVWDSVRASVRDSVGASVWDSVRASVRDSVWASVRDSVRASVWDSVRDSVRASVVDSVWASVWDSVWDSVWAYIGTFFLLKRSAWKYTGKINCEGYPFQPAVTLWELGLVPSFDGRTWRLHGGPDGRVLWEGAL
jgi:hypothetical protein